MNLDCTICGATSEAEIGGVPVCLDCFHDIQEGDLNFIRVNVKKLKNKPVDKYDIIEEIVCSKTGITPEMMNSKSRKREIILSRQLCQHFAKEHNVGSLSAIGFRFGRKDHATVLHSNRTINNLKETDKVFRAQYEEILNLL